LKTRQRGRGKGAKQDAQYHPCELVKAWEREIGKEESRQGISESGAPRGRKESKSIEEKHRS